jgi:hypothetical protein
VRLWRLISCRIDWKISTSSCPSRSSQPVVSTQTRSSRLGPMLWFWKYPLSIHPYPTRSLPARLWHQCMERSKIWALTKPKITEEIWRRGLNPGLPNVSIHYSTYELMLQYM